MNEPLPAARPQWGWAVAAAATVAAAVALTAASQSRHVPEDPVPSATSSATAVSPKPGATATSGEREVAVLAGGCFWGMQEILRKIPGVLETEVGYTGGHLANPRYEDTHDSRSGHAEAVRIVFDPKRLSYETLLEDWFFRMHDPTTRDRQGNDVGTQYRSAIFYQDEQQRAAAEAVKARVQASGLWSGKIVTTLEKASTWYKAEDYHQDYLVKHPHGYTCHFLRPKKK